MTSTVLHFTKSLARRAADSWLRFSILCSGAAALIWFLVRVIPKPSRASYPCQRAAFPVATSFVIWLCGVFAIKGGMSRITRCFARYRMAAASVGAATFFAIIGWTLISFGDHGMARPSAAGRPIDWQFVPMKPNNPVGIARGVNPGRVVWARDPLATRWAGNWKQKSDQWWLDENTDQSRVDALLAATLTKLTNAADCVAAWRTIFEYYNKHSRQLDRRGYRPGEVVAVKINVNNSTGSAKTDNFIDASPQMVLAMVRQLVNQAHVRPEDIIVYDARRFIPPYILTKVWSEFKDVRFLQQNPPTGVQPKHPVYGDYRKLEAANWVEGITYSNGKYKDARLIPKQVFDATYLVNLAILKCHSYPRTAMDGGDEGQTGVTLTGKNHFGSIKGTPELHPAINTAEEAAATKVYSPIVDLSASPNLGAKTILFVLDGLYCGRKWQSYPQHFPNPPFNNRVEPYENPDWPASVLASMDGVALDSVGLDILFAQTRNNNDETGRPRILVRANADDYLFEMAQADHPPSGTVYKQGGKAVASLGVHERWDSDETKRYSRNLDPAHGKGIELIYLPLGAAANTLKPHRNVQLSPAVLPGKGLAQHDFLYAGEWDTRKPDQSMFLVRGGKVVWKYSIPLHLPDKRIQEFDDATLLSDGNIIFSRMSGAGMVSPDKKLIWNYSAPPGTEIHSIQSIGKDRVLIMRNGNPAQAMIFNTARNTIEKEIPIPTTVKGTHGQFRHIRMTPTGTILVGHMNEGKVVEYDQTGREVWSVKAEHPWQAIRLKNGNTLITGDSARYVCEVNPSGKSVWELNQADVPEIKLGNIQAANRLANGNTVICNWIAGDNNQAHWPGTVQVFEVTPAKQVVWALSEWKDPDLGPSTSIQLLDEPGTPEGMDQQR